MPTSRDGGFTMIEVIVTVALTTTLMSFAVSGWNRWHQAQGQEGAAVGIQSALRNAQQRAVTEGRSVCMRFDTATERYRLVSGRCETSGGTELQGATVLDNGLDLTSAAFAAPTGTLAPGVTFTSRGTASPGSVRLTRRGSSTSYDIRVEGLTGRVSIH